MINTISISEIQKNGLKTFVGDSFVQIVLANNKKSGLIFNKEALELFEQTGLLEEIEDRLLAHHMASTCEQNEFVPLEKINNALQVS